MTSAYLGRFVTWLCAALFLLAAAGCGEQVEESAVPATDETAAAPADEPTTAAAPEMEQEGEETGQQ